MTKRNDLEQPRSLPRELRLMKTTQTRHHAMRTPAGTAHPPGAVSGHEEAAFGARLLQVPSMQAGFITRMDLILDEVVRRSANDPMSLRDSWPRLEAIGRELVETAIAAGQLASRDLEPMVGAISAMIGGLVVTADLIPDALVGAAEGFKRMLRGTLLPRIPGGRSITSPIKSAPLSVALTAGLVREVPSDPRNPISSRGVAGL